MTKRIQRKRTSGWRMPPNTVYIGRPSKWGNPYVKMPRNVSLYQYRMRIEAELLLNSHFLDELKGKDLACWCSLNEHCHGDILLEELKEKD